MPQCYYLCQNAKQDIIKISNYILYFSHYRFAWQLQELSVEGIGGGGGGGGGVNRKWEEGGSNAVLKF